MTHAPQDLQIQALLADYAANRRSPIAVLQAVHQGALATPERKVWISLRSWDDLQAQLSSAEERRARGENLPLFGVPFAVKDNIDVTGSPTTAACPSFERMPAESAPSVEKLMAAGAILIGKTNLDQFATGLVGTRSPYGACSSVFDPEYISGGSSSGSAVAVALGQVSFALGTDTAGSGRIPAAFNNVVGLKPTRGLLSTRGVIPACRSLDCVSVFAGSVADCWTVLEVARGYDSHDPFSRPAPPSSSRDDQSFTFGVPTRLQFFGDEASESAFETAIDHLEALGGQAVDIDFSPFQQTAALLYAGPWVAERAAAVGDFLRTGPSGVDPTVGAIIRGGNDWSAVDCFRAQYTLHTLKQTVERVWQEIDVLLVPTAGTTYTHAQVAADPVGLNAKLGTYTNFTNLLDLCGIAVPAGFKDAKLPFGVTLLAPAFRDASVATLAAKLHDRYAPKVGATPHPVIANVAAPKALRPDVAAPHARAPRDILLAVVGAHLQGQPLHFQLTQLGAHLHSVAKTSAQYRLYALAGTQPAKPGLVRTAAGTAGRAIDVEVYALDRTGFGHFVSEVNTPLAIGTVELSDGTWVKGFVAEPIALEGALDISEYGGWRAYLASRA